MFMANLVRVMSPLVNECKTECRVEERSMNLVLERDICDKSYLCSEEGVQNSIIGIL